MHSFGSADFEPPKFNFHNNISTPAEMFFENLRDVIQRYETQLDENHQLVWEIACLNGERYRVRELGYINPSLMRFKAFDSSDAECEVLAHVASVQFILRVEEVDRDAQKRRIGFIES